MFQALLTAVIAFLQFRHISAVTSATKVTISPSSISASTNTAVTFTGGLATDEYTWSAANAADCSGVADPSTALGSNDEAVTVNLAAGTYKLCFQTNGETDSVSQTNGVLTVVAATSATAISGISPSTVTVNVATSVTLTGSANGDKYDWSAAGASNCNSITPSTAIDATDKVVSVSISTTGTYKLCYRASGGSDSVAQTNGDLTIAAASSAGSDPIIIHGNKKTYIWFPLATPLPMLQTPEINVHAEAFGAKGSIEQWFNHFLITSKHGVPVVDIKLKKDLLSFNRTATRPGTFESLVVTPGGYAQPLEMLPPQGDGIEVYGDDGSIQFRMVIGRMSSYWKKHDKRYTVPTVVGEKSQVLAVEHARIGKAARECVEVWSPSVNILICSSPALEYTGTKKAIEFAHLDMMTNFDGKEPMDSSDLKGILPEVWGLTPMTEATKAMLSPPKETINV
mmetsp:Transcript_8080/g.17064  ORF Transcript_8080/g.17064 Transcript_8080/m.17064 type:complete len:454 (-) Transcript_8080:109-1470(-)